MLLCHVLKIVGYNFPKIELRVKRSSHWIWMMMEKLLAKQAQDMWRMQCPPIIGGDGSCLWDIRCRAEGLGTDNDVMTWKCFPHYWPFVRGIHPFLMDSPHKGPVIRGVDVFFVINLYNSGDWKNNQVFRVFRCSILFWRHCNVKSD